MASPNEPFRMLVCGKNPEHLQAVADAVRPEVEVTHKASTLEAAISTIRSLTENKISLIMMGGGFSPSDYEAARTCHPDAMSVPWLRPDAKVMAAFREAVGSGGAGMGGPVSTSTEKGTKEGGKGNGRVEKAFDDAIDAGGAGMGAPVSTDKATETEGEARKKDDKPFDDAIDAGGAGMGAPVPTSSTTTLPPPPPPPPTTTQGGNQTGPPPQEKVMAPPAHVVASRAKKCVDEHIQELKEGKGQGEVWYF